MIVPRRVALRSLFTLTVAAFTGGALARIATTPGSEEPSVVVFDEMYGGHRIQARAGAAGVPEVLVDGRPLHLMRCADGGYLTPIDHYQTYPTPLAATRAAVDELGSAPLTRFAAAHGVHPGGSPRGVHT
ncbi:tyrosinase family oxidase copper chaperone [Streptomyces vilmorinianum]|uniref:tyrosinase family oxidase copper chaperone n=1 Tax=Streptomyces vilmorinianum TaxID=3051092 RepID=UPI0010FB2C95|nr:tyrosinase family oxidase copper chaperone [Streptomyces vilmorinianum]